MESSRILVVLALTFVLALPCPSEGRLCCDPECTRKYFTSVCTFITTTVRYGPEYSDKSCCAVKDRGYILFNAHHTRCSLVRSIQEVVALGN